MHALEDHARGLALDIEHALVAQQVFAVVLHHQRKEGLDLLHVQRARVAPHERLHVVVVLVVVAFEERRIELEHRVQVEAADVEQLADVGLSHVHLRLVRARVHLPQASHERFHRVVLHEVGLGQQDAIGEADLAARLVVLVERPLGVLGVHHRHHRVEQVLLVDRLVHEEGLRHRPRVGEARGLDDHAVELELALAALLAEVAEDAHQVATHGAAQAPVVHLDDLLVLVLHQDLAVHPGLAELVLDHGDALAVLLGEDAIEERRLPGAQESREYRNGDQVLVCGCGGAICHGLPRNGCGGREERLQDLGDPRFFKVPADEHQARGPVGVGPAPEPCRRIQRVLHGVHGARPRLAGDGDQALQAQDLRAADLEQRLEAGLEVVPGQWLLAAPDEGHDARIVAIGSRLPEASIGARVEPSGGVGRQSRPAVEARIEKRCRIGVAVHRAQHRGPRIERAQALLERCDSCPAHAVHLRDDEAVGERRLLHRLGMAIERRHAELGVDRRHDARERVASGDHGQLDQRGEERSGIGKPRSLDHHARESRHAACGPARMQVAQRDDQVARDAAADAARGSIAISPHSLITTAVSA